MPIVDSWIESQPGNSVHEYHRDHIGEVQRIVYHSREGDDPNAIMSARVPSLNQQLKRSELAHVEHGAANGEVLAVNHLTVQQRRRALCRGLMRGDTVNVRAVARFINNNVSDAQLDAVFNASVRARIRNRIAGVLAIDTALSDDLARQERI